jgi:hypothetical protein
VTKLSSLVHLLRVRDATGASISGVPGGMRALHDAEVLGVGVSGEVACDGGV